MSVNVLYSLLTRGLGSNRKCSDVSALLAKNKKLLDAITTSNTTTDNALAELYIRLCFTDKNLITLLRKSDPLNTYELVDFAPEFTQVGVLDTIDKNIKKLGIFDIENSSTVWDNIRIVLKLLLENIIDG